MEVGKSRTAQLCHKPYTVNGDSPLDRVVGTCALKEEDFGSVTRGSVTFLGGWECVITLTHP